VAKVFSTRKKKILFCSVCSRTTQLNTHTKKKKTGICNKINIDAHWLKETQKKKKKGVNIYHRFHLSKADRELVKRPGSRQQQLKRQHHQR
jgi:hypothetical protein